MTKLLQIRNIAGVSLLGFVMMFAAIAPSMNNAYAGDQASSFCDLVLGPIAGPGWVGIGDFEDGITLVKCFSLNHPCFDQGVPVKSDGPTTCQFFIIYENTTGQNVILKDAIPAEWSAAYGALGASLECDDNLEQANKGKKADKSATLLTCDATDNGFINGAHIVITTRESPATANNDNKDAKFKPTSCSDLFANDGAQLIAADDEGNPILVDDGNDGLIPLILAETGPLQVPVTGEECEELD